MLGHDEHLFMHWQNRINVVSRNSGQKNLNEFILVHEGIRMGHLSYHPSHATHHCWNPACSGHNFMSSTYQATRHGIPHSGMAVRHQKSHLPTPADAVEDKVPFSDKC